MLVGQCRRLWCFQYLQVFVSGQCQSWFEGHTKLGSIKRATGVMVNDSTLGMLTNVYESEQYPRSVLRKGR